ncbi:hypothetical protein [Mycobacterium sp. TY815]|uniref:hypothetical protein n=1 Tax=Mycobacterium sp. TY815 TaxID=3050581 RepID=UPI0027406F73|nr:hypothetical protein [Mycobacterium sp. TY815]MDP7707473.1 hypothetical protein [Mycobacterium sp. TY815]
MEHELPDRFDELRREWIAEHAGVWTVQKRRAELLNRRIRKRIRLTAGARPNPYDDNISHPLWARKGSTIEAWFEAAIVLICAVVAPIGWPLGYVLYGRIVELIPDRLRAYPIPALLWTATGIGALTALLYTPDDSLAVTAGAPYLIAQIPATFATAGVYGILNGWLAIDGSAAWWPLTPPPIPVDFSFSLDPDDLTAPALFEMVDPESAVDLTPVTQISQSAQPTRWAYLGLAACLLGALWMIGAVIVGLNQAISQELSANTSQF